MFPMLSRCSIEESRPSASPWTSSCYGTGQRRSPFPHGGVVAGASYCGECVKVSGYFLKDRSWGLGKSSRWRVSGALAGG
jgi:hypothetical protein